MMKETPLLFSRDMVRAYFAGNKTVTRRIVMARKDLGFGCELAANEIAGEINDGDYSNSPYGGPGDCLWIREAWRVSKNYDQTRPRDILPPLIARGKGVTVMYEAGGWKSVGPAGRAEPIYPNDTPMADWAGKGRPSIHMPRAFARIALDVVSVRIERLQDITEADAVAEGVKHLGPQSPYWRNYVLSRPDRHEYDFTCLNARDSFCTLWDSLNAARGFGWDTNPWVWRIEFPRFEANKIITATAMSDREWSAQSAGLREGCTVHVPGVGSL